MSTREFEGASAFSRISALLLVLGLAMSNSALFYFVIWDMLSPSQPYTAILFFVSGGAHLVYFFLPWFARSMLGPLFNQNMDDVRRFDGRAASLSPEHDNTFVTLCTIFGIGLCVATLGLLSLQLDFGEKQAENLALITKENCVQIGGQPEYDNGKLICFMPKGEIGAGGTRPIDADANRI